MSTEEFVRQAGNHDTVTAAAAAAANAANPKALREDPSEPKKIPTGSLSASPSSKAGPGLPVPDASPPQADPQMMGMAGAMPGFPGMPPPYMGGYCMPPFMGWPYMDPMAAAAMGKGGMMPPMYPGMPPPMYPGMPMPMMPPTQATGGKSQGKGQSEAAKTRRRRKAKTGKEKDEAVEVDESSVVRSEELNEVRRAGQNKCKLTLQDVMGQVLEFATDQHGSRFLQQNLESSQDAAEKAAVLNMILPQTKAMSKDQYGNFVIQKLFDIGTSDQRKALADELEGEVVNLSMDQHGCRVIQKALQLLPRDSQTKLAGELVDPTGREDRVGDCIENMHGNHVIQKCIEQMPPDSVNFIIDSVNRRIDTMAEHMYGCRIIQRLLEHCAPHQLQDMLGNIGSHTKRLSENLYGNYVVQHMLEHGRVEDKKMILEVVTQNIIPFAKNKCSSNVVEKCFEIASIGEHADALKDHRRRLYFAVFNAQPGLQELTDDKFGNYIVQRMLEYSRDEERNILKNQLLTLVPQLQTSSNGKHICNAMTKEFGIPIQTQSLEEK
jgi:pumilio RNA-binding family